MVVKTLQRYSSYDIKDMVVKDDIKDFATKDDIEL